ncbi:hypothetical protein ACH50O_08820 [Methylomonas sp. 2BW1-5-20]
MNETRHAFVHGVSGNDMDTKKKNILTAVVLTAIALTIYVFAVLKAISQ